ncbi:MAG: amidohydrolase family protein [Deltaproteobacteria bacterium]|nr:amidohydrolase family protein [Deltaproteobacteria bacterium]MBW2416653.1 amidohydrolase family protein [Deltaproteobacteria bacterium]
MPYAHRTIHDADAHIMETPDWLAEYADPDQRERFAPVHVSAVRPGESELIERFRAQHADPSYRAEDEAQILLRKNWAATGSFIKEDRPAALDLLGFQSQLVFNTFLNGKLLASERGDDADETYAMARAHNRGMLDFCSVDRRLLATAYIPLRDFDRSDRLAGEAIDAGARSLLVPSGCPLTHSPSHVRLDPIWRRAEEAGLPVVFHVGGGARAADGQLLDPAYFENGGPPVPDFHGGDENFRSIDYMAIPTQPMQTLATMILDGVLDRFPRLRLGVIEQGASWLPSWMRYLDSAFDAFRKREERLQALSMRPSDFVKRQVRVTPYPAEDVGWIVRNSGDGVCLFSSDYPHVEGGRNPIRRFEESMKDLSEPQKQAFYCDNMIDLMGNGLTA